MIDIPVRVRDSLKDGLYKKRYRIHVLNDDDSVDFILDNTLMVTESVKLTERLCSSDKITFGLAEGSDLEFQYFESPDITGRRIQLFLDCYYHNNEVVEVNEEYIAREGQTIILPTSEASEHDPIDFTVLGTPDIMESPHGATVIWDDEEGHHEEYVEMWWSITKTDELSDITIKSHYMQKFSASYYSKDAVYTIPMGFFTVDQCARQASTGIIKASCYNKLQSEYLDKNIKTTVCDLVRAGEGGIPNELTIGTLLSDLLNGYRMRPDGGISETVAPVVYGNALWNVDVEVYNRYNLTDSDFAYSKYIVCLCDIIVSGADNPYSETHTTTNDFYNYKINGTALERLMYEYNAPIENKITYRHYLNDSRTNYLNYVHYRFVKQEWSEASGFVYMGTETRREVNPDNSAWMMVAEEEKPVDFYWDGYSARLRDWTYSNLTYSSHLQHGSFETGFKTGNYGIHLKVPLVTAVVEDSNIDNLIYLCKQRTERLVNNISQYVTIEKRKTTGLENKRITLSTVQSLDSITLRDLQSSTFELLGQYGKLDRETDLFGSVTLGSDNLTPNENLYPHNELYPSGAVELGHPAMFSKLWATENNVRSFRYLYVKYKDTNGNEQEASYEVNSSGTDDYYIDDNWILMNLTWTRADLDSVIYVMIQEMKKIKWFPFEMWCAGLPYIEAGDKIEIMLNHKTYASYILTRTLSGIQKLEDTYCNGSLNIF